MATYNLIDKIKNKQHDEILHLFLNHSKKLMQKFNENNTNEIWLDMSPWFSDNDGTICTFQFQG